MTWTDQREELVFPTRIARARCADADLLATVTREILARAERVPTVARGELDGWQSADDLASWSPATGRLVDAIAQAVMTALGTDELELFAWANVLRDGDAFSPHTHANSTYSGVLYLDAGEAGTRGGLLCIRDPRAGAGLVIQPSNAADHADTLRITPAAGELLAFPAWLLHWVSPYRGGRPRVSVGFNAR